MSEKTNEIIKKKYYDPVSMAKRTKQVVYKVEDHDKMAMLAHILNASDGKRTVVLCKSKKRADALGAYLSSHDHKAKVIHGNHRQSEREESAKAFNSEAIHLLITTDMVLPQLELSAIERIVSFDIPSERANYFKSLAYVDEKGEIISFVSPQEEGNFLMIELALKIEISEMEVEGFVPTEAVPVSKTDKDKKRKPKK